MLCKLWRKTRDRLSAKDGNHYSQGIKHLLSPGISSKTFIYLKSRKVKSHPDLHLRLFFDSSSFPAGRDLSSQWLSQRVELWGWGREGEQWKSYREDKKRSSVTVGRDGKERGVPEDIRTKRLVNPVETKPGNHKHPPFPALNSLKTSSKGCLSFPSSIHSWKMSSHYYNQVLNDGKCYWQLITLCIKIYVRVQT